MSISLTLGAIWVTEEGKLPYGYEVPLTQGEINRVVALERVLAFQREVNGMLPEFPQWRDDRGGWF